MTNQDRVKIAIRSLIPMLNHTTEILIDDLKISGEFEISDKAAEEIINEITNAHDVLLNITNMIFLQDRL